MIIDGIQVEKFNNQEYVLLCTYMYKGEKIYCFSRINDQVFCTKENENYIPVTDKFKINLYKNLFGFARRTRRDIVAAKGGLRRDFKITIDALKKEIKRYTFKRQRLPSEEEQKIIEEQKENFRGIKEKFGLDIDIDNCDRILEELRFTDILETDDILGFYFGKIHQIGLSEDVIKNPDSKKSRETRLHECIHSMMKGKVLLYCWFFGRGLLEGQTEDLATAFMGDENASSFSVPKRGQTRTQTFNFPEDTSYKESVCLIRQMQAAIGMKSYESIINGDFSFEREFIKQYGMTTFLFMAGMTDLVSNKAYDLFDIDKQQILSLAQNQLLTSVFNKDFEKIGSIEDAQKFFEKLRSFETVRAKDEKKDNKTREVTKDNTYQEYYEKMYQKAFERLQALGISQEEIKEGLEDYQYKEQEFYAFKDHIEEFEADCVRVFSSIIREGRESELKDFKMIRMTSEKEKRTQYALVNNGQIFRTGLVNFLDTGETKELIIIRSFEALRQELAQGEYSFSDITEEMDLENIYELAAKRAEEKRKENEQQEQQEQQMVPYQKQNIFQKMFSIIKDAFEKRKRKVQPASQIPKETSKEPEKIPSWDMRNYSEEEQRRAKEPVLPKEQTTIENQGKKNQSER